jgi:two-component system OmpR family sensor kinase
MAALLAVVSLIVGVVSVTVFHGSSVQAVDAELHTTVDRAVPRIQAVPLPGGTIGIALNIPGQAAGTVAGYVFADGAAKAGYIAERGAVLDLDQQVADRLGQVPADGQPHDVDLGGALGAYRAIATPVSNDATVVLALPLAQVNTETGQLALTIALVALAGVLFAIAFGSLIVRRALVPLARMTDTALAVSERPLDRGDVDLDERVPVDDPSTEVGRLGTAFNRMLGHVASSLSARELSERKVRRFVADASHELRTPLASIRGYAELTRLHGGELPDDVTHAISRIESESLRMTELVEDLLLLARLDEGRELVHSRIDVRTIVVDAVGDAQVAGADHEWSVEVPDAPVEVAGDDARLRQVLANLLANARLHTPEGTAVHVTVEPRPPARSGAAGGAPASGSVRITVADDGPGIDDAVRDRLFERFARGDASRSRRAGSTGLGLAIVRAVVEAHHGTVSVESGPGRTAFTVELPLADPAPAE